MDFLNSFTSMISIGIVFAVIMLVVMVMFVVSRYKTCPPNKILVKSGWIGGDQSAKVLHGGGTFVWPVIQEFSFLDKAPISTDVDLKGALSKQNIRVDVPSSFTFRIGGTPELMNAAAENLLGQTPDDIEKQAREMIFGQLRATIATMDIEEINGDRDKFEKLVMENIETELRKLGLELVNVNISDIKDESGYLSALGKEAASRATSDAQVKVANNERNGAIGQADAQADQRQKVAEANARAIQGENSAAVTEAQSKAEREVAEAEAARKSSAAKSVAEARAQQEGYAAEQDAETARADRDRAAQFASEVVPAEIAAQKLVVEARARKEAADLDAAATKVREAAPLLAQAEGFEAIVKAAGGDVQAAVMMMIADQMPTIVEAQAKAISNINFGEITVVGGADTASDFLQSTTSMLPMMHQFAKGAGIELPGFLGKLLGDTPVLLAQAEADNVSKEDDNATT